MKKIKKTTQDFVGTATQSIKKGLSPLISHINHKLRLKGRIRLANVWASKHPKRFFAFFLATMTIIISSDFVFSSFIHKNQNETSLFNNVANVDDVFDGMRKIESNRENIKNFFSQMIDNGAKLNLELDSINKIENKTHEDSIQMKRIISQLTVISNILNDEKN